MRRTGANLTARATRAAPVAQPPPSRSVRAGTAPRRPARPPGPAIGVRAVLRAGRSRTAGSPPDPSPEIADHEAVAVIASAYRPSTRNDSAKMTRASTKATSRPRRNGGSTIRRVAWASPAPPAPAGRPAGSRSSRPAGPRSTWAVVTRGEAAGPRAGAVLPVSAAAAGLGSSSTDHRPPAPTRAASEPSGRSTRTTPRSVRTPAPSTVNRVPTTSTVNRAVLTSRCCPTWCSTSTVTFPRRKCATRWRPFQSISVPEPGIDRHHGDPHPAAGDRAEGVVGSMPRLRGGRFHDHVAIAWKGSAPATAQTIAGVAARRTQRTPQRQPTAPPRLSSRACRSPALAARAPAPRASAPPVPGPGVAAPSRARCGVARDSVRRSSRWLFELQALGIGGVRRRSGERDARGAPAAQRHDSPPSADLHERRSSGGSSPPPIALAARTRSATWSPRGSRRSAPRPRRWGIPLSCRSRNATRFFGAPAGRHA